MCWWWLEYVLVVVRVCVVGGYSVCWWWLEHVLVVVRVYVGGG